MAESIQKGFTSWMRRKARAPSQPHPPRLLRCSLCASEIAEGTLQAFEAHLTSKHAELFSKQAADGEKTRASFEATVQNLWAASTGTVVAVTSDVKPENVLKQESGAEAAPSPVRGRDTIQSSASSLKREGSRSLSPAKKSKARPASSASAAADVDSVRRPPVKGTLWTPGVESPRPRPLDRTNVAATHRTPRIPSHPPRSPRTGQPPSKGGDGVPGASAASASAPPGEDLTEVLVKQPETRPISQEQLVAEVKGIYAGLIMVETKCIEVDNAQNAQADLNNKLNNEQWQALIALHRTLLHEHHDFFLASQHPSAAPALRRLATKYAMPARMWRHGIHSFLELLRHRLPASLEHMLAFIYISYSMMALLYETVPAFEDTWIECLGDLGRYRMAIEDDDIRQREVWTAVSRNWYSKASDKAPTTGRLYHHLAILARPNGFQQLFYYSKSLCVPIQFDSARESIMTLLDPVMALSPNHVARLVPTELEFVRCHGILFSKKFPEKYEASANEFISSLDNFIARNAKRFLEQGYWIGIASCCSIASYGDEKGAVFSAIRNQPTQASEDEPMVDAELTEEVTKQVTDAIALANRTHNVILRRFGDPNILPYLHTTLVFLHHLTSISAAINLVGEEFPWKLTALMLNTLLKSFDDHARIEGESFPLPERREGHRPLPEDYAMRGLLWTDRYFPDGFFTYDLQDDDEKYMEAASFYEERRERVLYLGCRIAAARQGAKWLRYDAKARQFSVAPEFDVDLEGLTVAPAPERASAAGTADLGELPDAYASPSVTVDSPGSR